MGVRCLFVGRKSPSQLLEEIRLGGSARNWVVEISDLRSGDAFDLCGEVFVLDGVGRVSDLAFLSEPLELRSMLAKPETRGVHRHLQGLMLMRMTASSFKKNIIFFFFSVFEHKCFVRKKKNSSELE
uniref:Uncharacterized protein n=1 Tax=Cannabis sativa TaxID=3483 RepID=A0A803P9G3_CANSA